MSEANGGFDVATRQVGVEVFIRGACGRFAEGLMNIKWPGQGVKSHTDVENGVLSGHILATTCQCRGARVASS